VIIKKQIIFEAFKNGSRKAAICFYSYREKVIQINDLNNLYHKQKISKEFYHTELISLCNESQRIILDFDTSRINALNYLKQKEGFSKDLNKKKDKSLAFIEALKAPENILTSMP
jgi:hypothetical protein